MKKHLKDRDKKLQLHKETLLTLRVAGQGDPTDWTCPSQDTTGSAPCGACV